MYNKRLLSKIDLGKYNKPNPYSKDIITDPQGQYKYPGKPTRIPSSDITMKGVGYPVLGIADNGQKQMMQPGQDYKFPGAKYVDEYPQMRKGGGINSKKYTRSLEGIGELFRESALFKKPKSKKKKFFHPNAKYFQDGGITSQEEIDAANDAMMKARLAYAQMHGNPAAQRMVVAPDQPYDFGNGITGTHYMASMDNYAVPLIQDVNGQLMLGDYGPESAEAIRFDNPEDAMYFAENYKKITPDESYRKEEFQNGGERGRKKRRYTEEEAQAFPKDEWGQYVQEEADIVVRPNAQNRSYANDPRYKQVSESTAVNNIYQERQPSFLGKDPFEHRRQVIKQQRAALEKAVKNTSNKIKKYYKEYHNSPRYLEMLQKSDPENWSNVDAARRHNLENPITRVHHDQPKDMPRTGGYSMSDTGDITVLPHGFGVRGLLPHEWSHSTDRPHPLVGRRAIPDKDQLWINKHRAKDWFSSPEFARQSAQEKKEDLQAKNHPAFQEFLKDQKEWYDYVGEDTETRARLNDIRYQAKQMGIYDPFTEKVTPKTFKKLLNTDFESPSKEGFDALKQLKDVYTDEEILWMLNNISKNQDKGQDTTQPQMGKYGRIIKQFAPGGVASPKDLDPEHMKRYLADLRMQENSIRKGYKNGMWYPHASVEGGADTIAYGHKLTPNDSALKRGITEDQALKLQEQDVLRNQALAKKQVDKKYGPGTFDNLPQDSQMLLVDYQYNLGTLSGFPSFVKATVEGNKEKMLAEHKRFGAGKPLTKRNEWTANVINNLEIPKPYDPMKEVTVPLANVPDATSVVQPNFLQGPTAVELPPQQYQDGGEPKKRRFTKKDSEKMPSKEWAQYVQEYPAIRVTNKPKVDPTLQKLNALRKKLQYFDSQNDGQGPSNISDMSKRAEIFKEIVNLEAQNKEKLKNTPRLDQVESIGNSMLTIGKYFMPGPVQTGINYLLNASDAYDYTKDPNNQSNQISVISDILSPLKSPRTKLAPFSVVSDVVNLKQQYNKFQDAKNQQYQDGGIVELNGNQYKKDSKGAWTFTSGAPVTDTMTLQKLNYGEGKPVGSPVVQSAPGRMNAEQLVKASKNVKPSQPIERNVPRGNVSDATGVVQPFIPKPSFVDQPSLVESLKYPEKLQEEAQRLITSGAARDMGVTAKYLSPQNANSANPKSLQQLMIEEMTKKDFQKRLDQSRLNQVNKKWNQSSILGKAGDVTRSFLADPINVTEEAIWGDQYLPDRANILRDPRNPLNAYYRKETGYDNSGLNNMVNLINPFSSAADATVYARQGNLLGTAKEFGEGLLKTAILTRAPGALNSLMGKQVNLGALGATDIGTLAGATGVASGTLSLPTTAKALYKAGQTGKTEDIRAAVNQVGMTALDFIAPEVIGSKGALSALMKGERLTPLQQLSGKNIISEFTPTQFKPLALSTPGLNSMQELRRAIDSYRSSESSLLTREAVSQIENLYDQRTEVDRIIQGLRNEGNTNSPYFQAAIDERDLLTNQIDNFHNQQVEEALAAQQQRRLDAEMIDDPAQTAERVRQFLNPDEVALNAGATAAQNMNQRLTGSFDTTRPTPGVTEYTGSNLPAPIRTSQVYSNIKPGTPPVKFSEATREAIRRRPDRSRMTLEAQLRDANDPIDFVNRLRNQYANGNINREVYNELLSGLKDAVKPTSDMYEDFDFFKEIAATNPDKPYTGSMLSRNEALNELMAIPDATLDDVLRNNYGYGLNDIEFLFNNSGISDQAIKIGMNQVLDDYTFITKYNTPNPNAPALDFANRQTLSPQLKGNEDDLGMLNISKKSKDKIEKTRYSNKSQTTGTVEYNRTLDPKLPKVVDKKVIIDNDELAEELAAYEEAFSQIPKNSSNPVHMDIQNKLEDLRATQWLRTEYAQELRAAGLNPDEIEKITIVTSEKRAKSMVDKDGNVIGTLKFDPGVYNGVTFSQIGSTGLSTKYHGYNLKASGFKNWDKAQDALAKRYLDEELNKITNASDRKNPIVVKSLTKKANTKAAEEIALLQRNNNNRFAEALYRGVHHGIKDTRGGIGTKQHFASTTLVDPVTGLPVTRYRAEDYWKSQSKQFNDQGIPKAGFVQGPRLDYDISMDNRLPVFILRKKGGDVPKLLRFTQ
jgi:hypothetical protein